MDILSTLSLTISLANSVVLDCRSMQLYLPEEDAPEIEISTQNSNRKTAKLLSANEVVSTYTFINEKDQVVKVAIPGFDKLFEKPHAALTKIGWKIGGHTQYISCAVKQSVLN